MTKLPVLKQATRYDTREAWVISDWMQSSRRKMGTFHDEEEVLSETARMMSLPQEQQAETHFPLLSNEAIFADL
jgi:hypothetical protein